MPACSTCGFKSEVAFKFCPECGAEPAAAVPSEQRKTVTVLFCDLSGSTALGETLDPERLRAILSRYFEEMKAIVERHGGSVEKFIGDAVMAVFGVPAVHEDDALRAVRAAVEMRAALPELGLEGRIGVMTGEVVTGTAERLATGDAVNVAARLEQAAQPGEVLIGQPTLALVHDAVEVESIEPLALKGKTEPVPAYRLLAVHDAPERRHGARFVGRERELAVIREVWERVLTEWRCELVTVVGDAGVGKSRLVAEMLATIDATAVRGHCLPYGEGITYWPVVVVFDDIQWGEETFLDLVEHVALLSSGASILLLCMARPEFVERRPAWPVTFRLEPLSDQEVEHLIAERGPENLRGRIARASGGNPLFIEEMLAMASTTDGEVVVPPTLRALLAARLDQLEPAERSVLERGAVEGEIFHRGAVQALAPDEGPVTPRLAALVRKELIRPARPQLAGEDGFRFRHILIRDAAYDALPKATRAELHARFATWLEEHGVELVELDEILGYHLEHACRYRAELAMPADPMLAAAARRRLTAGGRRAHLRSDFGAAVSLYERAAALMAPAEFDVALETGLSEALFWAGKGVDALGRAESLAERAVAAGDRVGSLCGRIQAGISRTFLEPEGATETLAALVEEALPVFEAAGDEFALYIANYALGWVRIQRVQIDTGLEAFELAAYHARQAGLPFEFIEYRSGLRLEGTTPIAEVLLWLDENEAREGWERELRDARAGALAMLGRFDEARTILADLRSELAERGGGIRLAAVTGLRSVDVELLADDPAAAAELGSEGCRLLEELGERALLSTVAGKLAQALYALDRFDEADAQARRAADLGASDDAATQMLWRQVRAKVLARRGEQAEAERLALQAIAVCDETDMLDAQGDVYADVAEVFVIAGKHVEAAAALQRAFERYDRKGNLVSARRAQMRLADLQGTAQSPIVS